MYFDLETSLVLRVLMLNGYLKKAIIFLFQLLTNR